MVENIPIPIQIVTGFSTRKRWILAAIIWCIHVVVCLLLGYAQVELPILGVWVIAVGLLSGVVLGRYNILLFIPLLYIPALLVAMNFGIAEADATLRFMATSIIGMVPGLFTGILSSMVQSLIAQQKIIQEQNTELESVNKKLLEAYNSVEAANQMKDEFISTMSHELRTPLSSIIGYSDLMLDSFYGDLNEKQTKSVQRIQKSGRQLLSIVNSILDFSKFETGVQELQSERIAIRNLAANLRDKIQVLLDEKSIVFTLDIAPDVPTAFIGDETYLTELIMNLLSNAVKFTESGNVSLCFAWQSNVLHVTVTDTGIGIPDDMLENIFEPFWQMDSSLNRQYSGVGMGLAFVKHLVKAMNGQIKVTSTEGVGSTFTVALPTQAVT